MTAVLRPDSWNLPLFLHVLGATLLFGAVVGVLVLSVSGRARPFLARYAFRAWLLAALPAFLLMRISADWILSREKDQIPNLDDKGWVGVGFAVGDAGAIVLLLIGITAWWSARKAGIGRARTIVAVLTGIYIAALAVAWFAMSTKHPS